MCVGRYWTGPTDRSLPVPECRLTPFHNTHQSADAGGVGTRLLYEVRPPLTDVWVLLAARSLGDFVAGRVPPPRRRFGRPNVACPIDTDSHDMRARTHTGRRHQGVGHGAAAGRDGAAAHARVQLRLYRAGACDRPVVCVYVCVVTRPRPLAPRTIHPTIKPSLNHTDATHTHTQAGSTMDVHDAEGKKLSTFTAQAGETLTFDLVGDDLVTPDGKHRISKTHRYACVGMWVGCIGWPSIGFVGLCEGTHVLHTCTQRHQRGDDGVQGAAGREEEADGAHQRALHGDGIDWACGYWVDGGGGAGRDWTGWGVQVGPNPKALRTYEK